jgi:general L-amino acid transport system substrate-binding protein
MQQYYRALRVAVLVLILAGVGGYALPALHTDALAVRTPAAQGFEQSVLQRVRDRGRLICGIHGELPGFSYIDSSGEYSGFDVDFCRVVATAIFGDPTRMEFRTFTAEERFAAVQAGDVDVLFRNTTWTATRDVQDGIDFGPTTFYDGQGFMAPASTTIGSEADLTGKTICVQADTTSLINLTDHLGISEIDFETMVMDSIVATYDAYEQGECDVVTSDRSQLVARRTQLANPGDHTILDFTVSREPLGPVFIEDDSKWRDVVSWAVFATIYAEELGVNQANVEAQLESDDPNVRRLLGLEGDIGANLGLENDFALNIVRTMGNYGDIYLRNLGPDTPFDLERGPNVAWNRGEAGVLASPPFR